MGHNQQERYSNLVLAKLRASLVLKDGVVFNNDYEGKPTAGAVKIPTRDTEVAISDYDKANGIAATNGKTDYVTLPIDKDKAVNEIIDGYDAASVPDNLVADRLDSAGYVLALQMDKDGATALLAGGEKSVVAALTPETVYNAVVDIRTMMSKANIPNDGRRYLLVTPDTYALMLKDKDNFIRQGDLAEKIKATGAIGQYAGFNLYEWNDSTANLAFIAGHPKFATRAKEFSVPVKVQDLSGSGKYIGASAVQGRIVYAHKVLRSKGVVLVYSPTGLLVSAAAASTAGKTVATVTGGNGGNLFYRLNPAERAKYGDDTSAGFTALTSGTTAISAAASDIIEVVEADASGKVVAAGYVTAVPKA